MTSRQGIRPFFIFSPSVKRGDHPSLGGQLVFVEWMGAWMDE